MTGPEPSPRPNPPPVAPPEDDDEAYNLKKFALRDVREELSYAKDELGVDDAVETGTAKSAKLTDGLGAHGHIWHSTLSETTRTELVGIIDAITGQVSRSYDDVDDDWNAEPDYVDKDDPRAKWGVE
ncbi:hypothetical protein [Actinomyces howellii]|uniref:Uncharacterized protein n=1 Tax=Actinomyces howellii TaxID=52771 RepID=A0A448HHZ6_9ACTO|nr:hypothetical protein [Actinomyces howellii]VEG28920.1 Uncharacterised protein [Actinomyces howellii]